MKLRFTTRLEATNGLVTEHVTIKDYPCNDVDQAILDKWLVDVLAKADIDTPEYKHSGSVEIIRSSLQ